MLDTVKLQEISLHLARIDELVLNKEKAINDYINLAKEMASANNFGSALDIAINEFILMLEIKTEKNLEEIYRQIKSEFETYTEALNSEDNNEQ